ncbi:MAG TPA: acyltransferase domain-containing protein, partial [Candidatus Polarisedimenticolia bacterium]|nr:acyltransferase domain-containing protein [Candidatus Polarisedimenticolia bacterium]
EADGTLLGEGAGVVVLKRLEEALDDGDRIYSVLRSVGTASDGKAMGILAPRVEGEELAMRRAYERGGIDPDSVGLLEAHGTGTPVGDATEIEALRRVFGADDKSPRCALGSVKSMIGHCIPAAAAAGLIKAALAVYHNVLPPTLHADASNPRLAGSRFYLNTETRPWVHAGPAPRRAGVSAFGFGGINAHAILEEAPPVRAAARGRRVFARNLHARRESELFVLSAASRAGLLERCAAVRRFVAANPGVASPDLAYTLNCPGPEPGAARLAIVAASIDELEKKLAYAGERLLDPARSRLKEVSGIYFFEERLGEAGDPAFLFPGEGAQYPGMLADLCLHFPEARAWFDLMDRAFRDHHRGVLPSQVVFPPPGGETDQATRRLWEMDSAIESVFAANQALHAILTRLGVRPQAVAGHSTGEYSALLASGAAEAGDEGRLIEQILDGNAATERATRSGVVPQGVLLAVGPADEETLRSVLSEAGGGIFLAMDNCPHQVVLCGTEEAVGRVQLALRSRGAVCQRLPFGRAYHTPLFAPVCEELRGFYERARFAPPRVPLYSCASAAPVPADPEAIRRLALEQWCRPVRFRETIEAMYAAGIRVFVEVGPRGNLTAFVEDILRGRPHLAVASNLHRRPGITQLHHLLALLAAHGLPLRLEPLYEDRASRRLPLEALREGARLPARPDRALRLSLALPRLKVDDATLARLAPLRRAAAEKETTAARERSAVARAPVAPPGRAVPANGGGASGIAAGPGASVVIKDFLSTMDNFLKTQDEVLRSALGHAGRGGVAEEKGSPLAGRIVRRGAGGSLTFHRTLSLEEDLFLLDHTLGGRISADETLRPLSIVPLTMSLEMMAEAAAATAPGLRPVGLRSVRAHRWLALTMPRLALEVVATPRPGCGEVDVRVSEMFSDATPARLTLEAVVLLADRLSGAPAEAASAPRAARSSRWRPGDLYAEGQTHGMFHGPSFRGVVSIDRVGEDGAEATLRALPSAGLFRSGGTPPFLLDALLLDAASQVIGYWTAEFLERDFVVFPIGLDRLEIFAAPLVPPATARCRTRCDVRSDGTIRADLEVAGPDGRLLVRLSGWEVKRIRLPERIYAFRLAPRDVLLSDPLPAPDPADDAVRCCRLEIDDRLLSADGGIWREGLAHLALAREEREAWRALSGSEARRGEWLVGRLAAKDAVRLFLRARHGLAVYPADVVIRSEGSGRPVAAGPWVETIGQA